MLRSSRKALVRVLILRRFEREAWDLFGIFFKNHPDLYVIHLFGHISELTPDCRRRIMTDYGSKLIYLSWPINH